MRLVGLSAVIFATAALTACAARPNPVSEATSPPSSPVPPASPSQPGVVPWVDQTGSLAITSPLPPAPVPTDGPACAAADVAVSPLGQNGGGGHTYQTFAFRDAGPRPCILRGHPRAVATEPGKQPVVAANGGFFAGGLVPETMTPGGVTTDLNLETERDCAARGAGPGNWPTSIYHTVTVSIPGGGDVVLRGSFDVECGLYVSEFGVPPADPVYPTPLLAGATITLELPSSVKAAEHLRYVVGIGNPTSADMVLDPCPSYSQQGPGDPGKTPLLLNCGAVKDVAAGQSVRFAMQILVPADTPTGPAQVCWTVVDITSGKDRACGSVEVEGADTPCTSDQLTAAIAGPGSTPGPSNMYALKGVATQVPLTLTNRSATTCSVRGAPKVAIAGSDGSPLKLTGIDEGQAEMSPVVVTPPTVVLAPGASATTHVYWYLPWCAPDPNPVTVTITLPANGAAVSAKPAGGWTPPPCKNWPGAAAMTGETSADPLRPA